MCVCVGGGGGLGGGEESQTPLIHTDLYFVNLFIHIVAGLLVCFRYYLFM